MMLRATVVDVDPRDPTRVWVTIPQKYKTKPLRVFTRVQVSKGDHVYVVDTSVTRVPQWVVFDQQTEIGRWGNAYPHTHPIGQVDGLNTKLGEMTAATTALTDTAATHVSKGDLVLNVRDYGATGNGSTDDTANIQKALTAGAGRTVLFPAGTYKTGPLNITGSNTRVVLDAGARITLANGGSCFQLNGTPGPELPISTALTTGATQITTTTAHGLSVGDWLLLTSQRDALSTDAGDDWKLGHPTSGGNMCYFGEWHQVAQVVNTTTINLRGAVLFPDYRPDKTKETSTYARASAVIQKISPVENVTITGGTVRSAGGSVVNAYWAKGCVVDGVRHECPSNGYTVTWNNSYGCEARNCTTTYPPTPASTLTARSSYKAVSSQECGFVGCVSENAAQAFDVTYRAKETCSVHCYVRECRVVSPESNPLTTHGGTYGSQVVNNVFRCPSNGMAIRSRNSVISGNVLEGGGAADSMGIYLYEGWARDCVITGNTISGFEQGIVVRDATDLGERFGWIGCVITSNRINKVKVGVNLSRWAYVFTGESGAVVADNVINLTSGSTESDHGGVMVGSWVNGALITNNRVQGQGTGNGVVVKVNAANTVLSGNYVSGTKVGVRVDGRTHTQALPPRVFLSSRNYLAGASTPLMTANDTEIRDGGAFAGAAVTKPGNPGTATGSDAAVINGVVKALQSLGLVG